MIIGSETSWSILPIARRLSVHLHDDVPCIISDAITHQEFETLWVFENVNFRSHFLSTVYGDFLGIV